MIREMTINDIDDVYNIEVLSFTEPWSKTLFEDELENDLAHYFVYEYQDKVIGYVGMYHILNEGHITNIAVNPDFRGKGIGKELIRHILKYSKENEIVALTLEVRISNTVAQNLYKSFGFKEAGIRKNYYKNPIEDAVIMWLYLD